MNIRIITVSAALGVLAGCAVGPDYVAPVVPTPETFHEASADMQAKAEIDLQWWRSFGDQQLTDLIENSLRANHDLEAALAKLNEARALRRSAQLNLLPTTTIGAEYTKSKDSGARLPFPDDGSLDLRHKVYTVEGDSTWELDLFGRVRRDVEARSADEEAAIADLQDLWHVLSAEVAAAYLQLRGTQAELEVAERNAKNQAEALELIATLVKAGQSPEVDQVRAQVQLHSTQALVPALQADMKVAIHQLSVLCGKLPSELEEQLAPAKALPAYSGPVSLGDPAALLRRRPDVRAAERRLAAATAEIGVAEGELFPRVSFSGRIALEAQSTTDLDKSSAFAYGFGPRLTWAALDLGHVLAQIKAAGARSENALAVYQGKVLTALQETENALVRFTTERDRRALLKTAAEESKRALTLSRDRYKEGAADFLTVLDAERVVLASESQLVRSETQLSLHLLGIYKALGGGWENVQLVPE